MIQLRVHRVVDHVWSRDPALDKSDPARWSKAWTEFLETGSVAALPLRDGRQPTIWKLASLKREDRLRLGDLAQGKMADLLKNGSGLEGIIGLSFLRGSDQLVAAGLVGVVNLQDEHGRPAKFEINGHGVSKEQLDALHLLGMHFVNELGNRILEISEPDPTQGQA